MTNVDEVINQLVLQQVQVKHVTVTRWSHTLQQPTIRIIRIDILCAADINFVRGRLL